MVCDDLCKDPPSFGVKNMSTIGSWGLHTQVQPRFGARAIVERSGVSLLWDRSGVYGNADDQWLTDIDTVLYQSD